MKSTLLSHVRRYPLMEPRDAVKLIYQNEFGGGHLIRDAEGCMAYLSREYASTVQKPDAPLAESIGNGMVRIHLAALDAHHFSVQELCDIFIRSSSRHRGNMDAFQAKLLVLKELTQAGNMPFSPEALDEYLAACEKAGFPAVSHSEAYRSAYHPAYRVVEASLLPDAFRACP